MKLFHIAAFARTPSEGNPAAVCLLEGSEESAWMQQLAAELNLSETAFVYTAAAKGVHRLRWFTPTTEVALCGHATLAAAHVLFEERGMERVAFETLSGVLTARKAGDLVELDFPAQPVEPTTQAGMQALGAEPLWVGRAGEDLLIELSTESQLRDLSPDLGSISKWPCRGVIVTCRSASGEFDFISRFFAPAIGIDEDPVTGSAHCALGPFWGERLGKSEMIGYQASARGGVVWVGLRGDRVLLRGVSRIKREEG